MNDKSPKLEWELKAIKSKLGEASGRSYQLSALITGVDLFGQTITRRVPLALEWIRKHDERAIFWGWITAELTNFDATPEEQERLTRRIARVVEPATEEETAAVNQDPDRAEYKNAQQDVLRLRAQMSTDRTSEAVARYNEAADRIEHLLLKHTEKMIRQYQEETQV